MIKERLEEVRARIVAAAKRVGRDPASIRLVGVTKGIAVDRIREAIGCGVEDLGENRVQEAQAKIPLLGTVPPGTAPTVSLGQEGPRVRWHFIGHLQRNKARFAVELFDVIHSIDSVELMETLDREAKVRSAAQERRLETLVQVNVSGETTKHGCRPDQVEQLAQAILNCKHLKWIGLMTMAPYAENPEESRPFFRQLRELRDRLQESSVRPFAQSPIHPFLHLSMGMSQDFEVAIEEGATMVRVGTAIFGEGQG